MATSSLSLRFGPGLSSSGNIHMSPSLLHENELDTSSSLPQIGTRSGNNGSLPSGPLMMVDTSHHSLLSSIPTNSAINNADYGLDNRKMFCLQPTNNLGFQHNSNINNYNKDAFDDKFNFNSNLPVQDVKSSSHVQATHTSQQSLNKLKQERDILNNDIIVSEGQNDVTIEYMDLDEFLHENGLSNVCKGEEPQEPLSHHLEKHYPINLQHRGLVNGSPSSSNDLLVQASSLPTDLLMGERISSTNSSSSPPSSITPNNSSSLTCIIPPLCPSSTSLPGAHSNLYSSEQIQCSPVGSSNSLASPSSACSIDQNMGCVLGRSRRRSSTKSIDSGRSLSPSTEGEGGIIGKNGLEARIIKRSKKEMVPDIKKDANYWKKREKNNLAAKRSRDSRREREAQISYKTKFLENENANLQQRLEKSLRQNEDLKKRLSKYEPV